MKAILPFSKITLIILIFSVVFSINACTAANLPTPPCPTPVNHAPEISHITAPQEIPSSTTSQIACVALDVDKDVLEYRWTSYAGSIYGSGAAIEWTAPQNTGSYSIEVTVNDGNGGEVKKSVMIHVINKPVVEKPGLQPDIHFLLTKEDKTQLTVEPGDNRPILVRLWSTIVIECLTGTSDSDFNILWEAQGGKIEGQGSTVKYISTTRGDGTVTATVLDSQGGSIRFVINFFIACCGDTKIGVREQ